MIIFLLSLSKLIRAGEQSGPVSWRGDPDGNDLQPVFAAMAVSPISCLIFKYYRSEPQLEGYFLKCRLTSSFPLNFEIAGEKPTRISLKMQKG